MGERSLVHRLTRRKWGQYPLLEVDGVNELGKFTGQVRVPSLYRPEWLEQMTARVGTGLFLGKGFGYPEGPPELRFPSRDREKFRDFELRYKHLPMPDDIPGVILPAPRDDALRVGVGLDGPVLWELDRFPHCKVMGATGSGKTLYALRNMIGQAVQAGWLVVLIVGQLASDMMVWEPVPNVWVEPWLAFGVDVDAKQAELESLGWFATKLRTGFTIGRRRYDLCVEHNVDAYADLPDDVKLAHPRILYVVDEPNSFLSAGVRDPELKAARAEVGELLGNGFRQWRKYGANILFCDQMLYATSFLSDGAIQQAPFWVYLGGQATLENRRMVSGVADWPWVPAVAGCGLYGVLGDPHVREVRMGRSTRQHALAVIRSEAALWEQHRAGRSAC